MKPNKGVETGEKRQCQMAKECEFEVENKVQRVTMKCRRSFLPLLELSLRQDQDFAQERAKFVFVETTRGKERSGLAHALSSSQEELFRPDVRRNRLFLVVGSLGEKTGAAGLAVFFWTVTRPSVSRAQNVVNVMDVSLKHMSTSTENGPKVTKRANYWRAAASFLHILFYREQGPTSALMHF